MIQMNENRLFMQSKHNSLLLPLLSFEKMENKCKCFLDANLIWVAPECWDIVGLACLYRGTFGRSACSQKQKRNA
jgi:hypothetical protein